MNKEKFEALKKKLKEYAPHAAIAAGSLITFSMIVRQAQRLAEYEANTWVLEWTDALREETKADGTKLRFRLKDGNAAYRIETPED